MKKRQNKTRKAVASKAKEKSEEKAVLEVIPEFESILELPKGVREQTLVETICRRHRAKKEDNKKSTEKEDLGSWLTNESKKIHSNNN